MIQSFRHKGLHRFFNKGDASGLRHDLVKRIGVRLDALDAAHEPEDLNMPGFNFHRLRGLKPLRYTIHINGPFCLTFAWDDGPAEVDLENYH